MSPRVWGMMYLQGCAENSASLVTTVYCIMFSYYYRLAMIAQICPELTMPESSFKLSNKPNMGRATVSSSKGTSTPNQLKNCKRLQLLTKPAQWQGGKLPFKLLHSLSFLDKFKFQLSLLLTTLNKTKHSLICRHQINTPVLTFRKTSPLTYKLRII